MGDQLGSHLISLVTDGDALNCMVGVRWREMYRCELYTLEAELVRSDDLFSVDDVREKCQNHIWYCSGNSVGLLVDCEILLACPMVHGALADEQCSISKGYYEAVSSEESPAFHWETEVEGCGGEKL